MIKVYVDTNSTKRAILKVKKVATAMDQQEVDRVIEQVALDLQKWAWNDCPVDTGLLRGSISVKKVEGGYAVYVDDVYYAVWVHDGTRWMPPRPFLMGRNAVRARRELKRKLNRLLKTGGG